jgi:HSP20 family protein
MAIRDLLPWGGHHVPSAYRSEEANPFLALHREMNRLFDEAFHGLSPGLPAAFAGTRWPQVDVVENEGEFRVVAELPGLEEKDVEVLLDGTLLTLRGEKKVERKDEEAGTLHAERLHGRFQRVLDLGSEVQRDKVTAAFRNGVLTVTLPKNPEAAAKAKRIPVNAG